MYIRASSQLFERRSIAIVFFLFLHSFFLPNRIFVCVKSGPVISSLAAICCFSANAAVFVRDYLTIIAPFSSSACGRGTSFFAPIAVYWCVLVVKLSSCGPMIRQRDFWEERRATVKTDRFNDFLWKLRKPLRQICLPLACRVTIAAAAVFCGGGGGFVVVL